MHHWLYIITGLKKWVENSIVSVVFKKKKRKGGGQGEQGEKSNSNREHVIFTQSSVQDKFWFLYEHLWVVQWVLHWHLTDSCPWMELVRCQCKTNCTPRGCPYRNQNLACTELCVEHVIFNMSLPQKVLCKPSFGSCMDISGLCNEFCTDIWPNPFMDRSWSDVMVSSVY